MKVPAIALLLILSASTCVAGERNPIVTDLMSMKPCVGYLATASWGKTIDEVETSLRSSSQPDSIERKGEMILAAFGRRSKDQPMDSAKYVISASFKNGMFSVTCIEYFATEQEASAAVAAWNKEAGRGFVREKGRENEYWTTTCPDGTKIIAHGFALKASAMYAWLFMRK